jgi:hypothetical protein
MKAKKNLWLLISILMALPQAALASFSGSVGGSGNGWSFSVGVGSGGGGGMGGAYGLPGGSIFNIVENILFWLLAIIGVVSIIGFIIAGIMYLTAAGDETQAGKAKKALTYSIIGVIVGLSGFVVLQAVFYMLTGSSIF